VNIVNIGFLENILHTPTFEKELSNTEGDDADAGQA